MNPPRPVFDVLVLTAADDVQAAGYRAQLAQRVEDETTGMANRLAEKFKRGRDNSTGEPR